MAQQWGTTPPISTDPPSAYDLKQNDNLLEELRIRNNFPSHEDTEHRKLVLNVLQTITTKFIRFVCENKGLPPSAVDSAGGKVFTFGSYRLGVFGPGSDIDALIVAPKYLSRTDFFNHFPSILRENSPSNSIKELTPVPDAHVPIIKLEYMGVSVDLIFARLASGSIPDDIDLKQDTWLRGLDEAEIRAVNGTRVTDLLLTLVPEVKAYRLALRAVKLWAQQRAIYANVLGFPGGIAWALMVARISQLYPKATSSTLVQKFFHLMKSWNWSVPVMLKQLTTEETRTAIRLNVRVWNPTLYPADAHHLMPIITPAYPEMCATHNVSLSTKEVILRELERADAIAKEISTNGKKWSDLFEKHTFFTKDYKHYLAITTASPSKEAQSRWSGSVQARIRRLIGAVDKSALALGISFLHPYNKGFDRVHRCKAENISEVLSGSMQYQIKDIPTEVGANNTLQAVAAGEGGDSVSNPQVEGIKQDSDGMITLFSTTFYIGMELPRRDEKSLLLGAPCAEFMEQCMALPGFNPALNFLKVTYVRHFHLPDDVFEPGEQRPVKRTKKVVKKISSSKTANGTSMPQSTKSPSQQPAHLTTELAFHPAQAAGNKRKLDAGSSNQNAIAKKPHLDVNT